MSSAAIASPASKPTPQSATAEQILDLAEMLIQTRSYGAFSLSGYRGRSRHQEGEHPPTRQGSSTTSGASSASRRIRLMQRLLDLGDLGD